MPLFPHIVISSESEKSFSFAVRQKSEESGERETPCFMRIGITAFHADGCAEAAETVTPIACSAAISYNKNIWTETRQTA